MPSRTWGRKWPHTQTPYVFLLLFLLLFFFDFWNERKATNCPSLHWLFSLSRSLCLFCRNTNPGLLCTQLTDCKGTRKWGWGFLACNRVTRKHWRAKPYQLFPTWTCMKNNQTPDTFFFLLSLDSVIAPNSPHPTKPSRKPTTTTKKKKPNLIFFFSPSVK